MFFVTKIDPSEMTLLLQLRVASFAIGSRWFFAFAFTGSVAWSMRGVAAFVRVLHVETMIHFAHE